MINLWAVCVTELKEEVTWMLSFQRSNESSGMQKTKVKQDGPSGGDQIRAVPSFLLKFSLQQTVKVISTPGESLCSRKWQF